MQSGAAAGWRQWTAGRIDNKPSQPAGAGADYRLAEEFRRGRLASEQRQLLPQRDWSVTGWRHQPAIPEWRGRAGLATAWWRPVIVPAVTLNNTSQCLAQTSGRSSAFNHSIQVPSSG
jgi:hypothetical protein